MRVVINLLFISFVEIIIKSHLKFIFTWLNLVILKDILNENTSYELVKWCAPIER